MKVTKLEPDEKLAVFSCPNISFSQEEPVSMDLRKIMEEVHRDFTSYMHEQYFNDVQMFLKEFVDDLHPRENKRESLETNLFWWKILYDSSLEDWGCTEDFMVENGQRFTDNPLITSWLGEWNKAETKFYYVGYKYSDTLFFVIDILENKMLNVIVTNPETVPPKEGEIVVGTLIPYGDRLYSPIADFYRFDYGAREVMGGTFRFYFDKYLKSDSYSAAFVHVLSVMLQIERRIHLQIQRVK